MKSGKAAFTLIELITVVVLISILAAICVPNFLEAQVRSKTTYARVNIASLELGLKKYYADNGQYPPHRPAVRQYLAEIQRETSGTLTGSMNSSETEDLSFSESPEKSRFPMIQLGDPTNLSVQSKLPVMTVAGYDLTVLTTPIAYVGQSLPLDAFVEAPSFSGLERQKAPLHYLNFTDALSTGTSRWDLVGSGGVGGRFCFELKSIGPDNTDNFTSLSLAGNTLIYDPTNGTLSEGDIVVRGR